MASPRVRADYDGLSKLSQAFARQAAETEKTLKSVQSSLQTLRSGDWIGTGANAFFMEMDREVLPSLRRLATALDQADKVTRQISQVMKQAEEEAARLFQAGFVGGAAAAIGGAAIVSAASDPASGWGAGKLLVRDPHGLFKDEYMHGLIGLKVKGAGSDLRAAMNDLLKNPQGDDLKRALQRVAQLRDRPFDEINDGYQKFLRIRADRGLADAPKPPETSLAHPFFFGSNTNLRYGKVVGDAFGIDPVFGAMLNPTGGLVGPDNFSFPGDSTALGYHAIVHDAAGYLYTYHDAGPGYNYLGLEERDPGSPLTGQRAGIHYWRKAVGGVDPISYRAEEIMQTVVPIWDAGNWVIDKVEGIF